MTGIHHVGATVADLDRATAFYVAVLDGTIVDRVEPGDDPRVPAMVGVPDARIVGAMVETGLGARIELLTYATAHQRSHDVRPCDVPGLHLAFPVPDLAVARRAVLEHGGAVLGEQVSFDAGSFLYCADPDGNVLELVEPA